MFSTIKGLGVGAGLMYLLDPKHGGARRAELQDELVRRGEQAKTWLGEAVSDPGTHAPTLIAAAAGGIVGLKMLSRRPLTTLAIGAAGLALASPKFRAQITQYGWPGVSQSHRPHEFDAEELSHYSATSSGYINKTERSDPSPDPSFPDWPSSPAEAVLADPGPTS